MGAPGTSSPPPRPPADITLQLRFPSFSWGSPVFLVGVPSAPHGGPQLCTQGHLCLKMSRSQCAPFLLAATPGSPTTLGSSKWGFLANWKGCQPRCTGQALGVGLARGSRAGSSLGHQGTLLPWACPGSAAGSPPPPVPASVKTVCSQPPGGGGSAFCTDGGYVFSLESPGPRASCLCCWGFCGSC